MPDRLSMCLDPGVLDYATPDLCFLPDKRGGLGRRPAGGTQTDLRKVVLGFAALENLVHRLVELGNHGGWRLRRRGQRVPGAGLEALHADFIQCRESGKLGIRLLVATARMRAL